jgi:hypothetical protein
MQSKLEFDATTTFAEGVEITAAHEAIDTILYAVWDLMKNGGYLCLRRCDPCQRVFLTRTDSQQTCSPQCRWKVNRAPARTRNAPP